VDFKITVQRAFILEEQGQVFVMALAGNGAEIDPLPFVQSEFDGVARGFALRAVFTM
jgi:hypothetical protein